MTEKRYTITLGKNNEFKEIIDHCRQDKHISVIQFLKQVGEQDKAFKKLKQENKELKVINGEMEDYLARMEEENKELRSDRDYWKTLAQSLAKTNGTLKLKDEHIGWKRVDVE